MTLNSGTINNYHKYSKIGIPRIIALRLIISSNATERFHNAGMCSKDEITQDFLNMEFTL